MGNGIGDWNWGLGLRLGSGTGIGDYDWGLGLETGMGMEMGKLTRLTATISSHGSPTGSQRKLSMTHHFQTSENTNRNGIKNDNRNRKDLPTTLYLMELNTALWYHSYRFFILEKYII